ncbi:MAG: pitrilysin family protein [Alphaproteobacteria bacterium]|nr:pitrilysin family protein [Alphaproteobacteria bacterium]
MRISLILSLLAILSPGVSCAAVFNPETFTLANGLQFVVVKNRLSPAVSQMVWYKVGSMDEPPGKSGLAHYLEHLMFRGTASVPPGEFSSLIASVGGSDNAFTSHDYTAFHEVVAADSLPMIMQLEADRMQNLRIEPDVAAPELGVVLSERNERIDNNPQGKFHEKMQSALFPDHPYGIPIIGLKQEIEKALPEDVWDFYKKYYAPNNAVVIISGNVETNEVMRIAAATFGRVPRRVVADDVKLPPLKTPKEQRVVVRDERVKQPQFVWEFVAPSYSTQKSNEAYAFEVLREALDGDDADVLYRRMVVERKIASDISAHYEPDSRGPSVFSISATPQPGHDVVELERVLRKELLEIAKQGLSVKKITAAKERLQRMAVFARDSIAFSGNVFGAALSTGEGVSDVESWPERIGAVTSDEVNSVLRKLLKDKRQVVGILIPEKSE